MIAKVTFGESTDGLVRYLTSGAAVGRGVIDYIVGHEHLLGSVEYRNLVADEPRAAVQEMRNSIVRSHRVLKPMMHLSLSWHPSENPTDEQMIEAMDALLRHLGLSEHQAVYAVHLEKLHRHIHAGINRVGPSGRAWDSWQCYKRIEHIERELERELNFGCFAFKHDRRAQAVVSANEAHARTTAKEQCIEDSSGICLGVRRGLAETFAARVGPDVRRILRAGPTWTEVHQGLSRHGLALIPFVDPRSLRRTGLQIVDLASGTRCAASMFGADYGRGALERRFGPFVIGTPSSHTNESIDGAYAKHRPTNSTRLYAEYKKRQVKQALERDGLWSDYRTRLRSEYDAIRIERRRKLASLKRERLTRVDEQLARGIIAFESAVKREAVRVAASSRRDAIRAASKALSWSAFILAKAREGDAEAQAIIARARRRNRSAYAADCITSPTATAEMPIPSRLINLTYSLDYKRGFVHYFWHDGRRAFIDHGAEITMADSSDSTIATALELARAKWGCSIDLKGSAAFKMRVLAIAQRAGMYVTNVELQHLVDTHSQELQPRPPVKQRSGTDVTHAFELHRNYNTRSR